VACSVFVFSNEPNCEQPKNFINHSQQRLVHEKMHYLENIADVAFEILKENSRTFLININRTPSNIKVVKGGFVAYLHLLRCHIFWTG